MSSSRRNAVNENISTYDSAGGKDYSDLGVWESFTDIDLVSAAQSEVLECYKGVHDDDVNMVGSINNSSYHRIIRPAPGEGHNGIPKLDGTVVAFSNTSNLSPFWLAENYAQIQDLVLKSTVNEAADRFVIVMDDIYDYQKAIGCLVVDSTNTGSGSLLVGILFYNNHFIINCLIHNCERVGFGGLNAGGTGLCYNCGSDSNDVGFQSNVQVTIVTNCVSSNNTTLDWDTAAGGSFTTTTCTAENDTPVFNDAANDDLRLDETDYICRKKGTDLSSDGVFAFDDDIMFNTRTFWDIGFHANFDLSSRIKATNENVSTYDSAGGKDYSDLSVWEAFTDIDLVSAAQSEVLECYKGAHDDNITFSGATTNISYFRIIRAASSEGHSGVPLSDGSCVEFHNTGNVELIYLNEEYAIAQDLVGKLTQNTGGQNACFRIAGPSAKSVGCIAYDSTNAGAGNLDGFQLYDHNTIIVNCLAHNVKSRGAMYTMGGGNTGYIYSCTFTNNGTTGVFQWTGTAIGKNILASENAIDFAGTITKTTCNAEGSNPVYRDAANNDFRLSGVDTIGRNNGTDLSGVAPESEAVFPFNDDIHDRTMGGSKPGKNRVGLWGIGFYQFYSRAYVT